MSIRNPIGSTPTHRSTTHGSGPSKPPRAFVTSLSRWPRVRKGDHMTRSFILVVTAFVFGSALAGAQTTREVAYSSRSVVPVHTKLRFTTMIILPEHEEILDF